LREYWINLDFVERGNTEIATKPNSYHYHLEQKVDNWHCQYSLCVSNEICGRINAIYSLTQLLSFADDSTQEEEGKDAENNQCNHGVRWQLILLICFLHLLLFFCVCLLCCLFLIGCFCITGLLPHEVGTNCRTDQSKLN
jgi:hypothetical protein